ncbi:MAG: hypothetical protein M4579_001414 [Chaenotheca gracillima]|nr:MAG: hypothetical protein M4579_001414 [Chaenotheca gracillima]
MTTERLSPAPLSSGQWAPSELLHPRAESSSSNAGAPPRIRRRNRLITSCLECRRRKLKCDRSHPCKNCIKACRDCIFLAPALDAASQSKLTEIKEKVGSLEQLLERDVARGKSRAQAGGALVKGEPTDEEEWPEPEDERNLEPTPLSVIDAAYDDDADDELFDLGFQLGKLRLTERIGGYFRPRVAEEINTVVNNAPSRLGRHDAASPEEDTPTQEQLDDLFPPAPEYLAPSPGFFFSGTSSQASLIDYLPSMAAADRLIAQYFAAVHPIARAVHRPTFERQYAAFWSDITVGMEPPRSMQAVIFSALFSGIVSMREEVILQEFGVGKATMVDNFRLGTETALARAGFLRSTKIETLQAFVMYLIPLCRAEVSRAHSVLAGTAIRLAQCIGLHRDPENYGLSPVETHVRRLLWYQLCFLDIRTCEAQGPQPTIRQKDYDTKMPLNVDDDTLHYPHPPTRSLKRWTDVTFSLMRFECTEMHRTIWVDRPRLEKKKTTLTAVLAKIERFRKGMEERYFTILDLSIPIQRAARLVLESMMDKMHIMVLNRYVASISFKVPDRLRQMSLNPFVLTCGTRQIENAVTIETDPSLSMWAWYAGAYQQYHTAFLLLFEVHQYPMRREADRIWACLDYVFETDRTLRRDEKGRRILTEVQKKSTIYSKLRKTRVPISMMQHRTVPKPPPDPVRTVNQGDGTINAQTAAAIEQFSNEALFTTSGGPHAHREGSESSSAPSYTWSPPAPRIEPSKTSSPATTGSQDNVLVEIDWSEWNKVFPPEINTGDLNIPMDVQHGNL